MTDTLDNIQINFNADNLWVVNLTLSLVMFGVALDIKTSDFTNLLKSPKPVIVGIISQFILIPLVTYLMIIASNPYPSIALGMMMVAACPGGNISNFMTKLAGGNAALSVSLTAFASLAALVMTPLNFAIWGSLYEPTATILKNAAGVWKITGGSGKNGLGWPVGPFARGPVILFVKISFRFSNNSYGLHQKP